MKAIDEMSRAELGAFVQEHLRGRGIDVVLSGGSCVSIYSQEKYVSMDLDMIHTGLLAPKRAELRCAMGDLGFVEKGRYFKHPNADLVVEFPPGPPAVGEERVRDIQEQHEVTGILRLVSPTDCVKDRLTWLYHDNDRQALDQAILVAQANPVDLDEVERWSKGEGRLDVFKEIRDQLSFPSASQAD